MVIKDELTKFKAIIEDYLDEVLPEEEGYQNEIFKAMRYSVFAGGKRLRPFLTLKTCEIICGDYKPALPFAAALEMIHTYSLIHDDLPAMDNDDFRRGKPTNHKVYGEGMSVLAGDGLLNYAYEIMTKSLAENGDNLDRYVKALSIVSNASGIYGMIGGQVADILSEDKKVDKDTLDFIHKNKTSALIEAAVLAGGIIGGATDEEIVALKEYGQSIGLGFQIRDDILDKIGTMEQLGKDIGSDEGNNKATYLSLYGLDFSINKTKELSNKAKNALKIIGNNEIIVMQELAEYLVSRES
ncbi:polyprenyl synthetase family protein [Sporosalibacterium faouarense]|uniref:polyprenyl synthetase family protein n=1 Tax=Sporosalibacterium faouarense TaxID=516123 RepID=UPI00141D2155|nr:farnesyl diphosphate synthase [Sporosalibacterium faouarense]MTI48191.1 polyprenyl synthetase family protein [Bacillota bacterium]